MCPSSFVFINVPALVLSFHPARCEWHCLRWVLLMVPTRSQLLELLNRHQHTRVKKTHRKLFPVAFPMLFISIHDFNGCAYFDIIEDVSHFSKVKMLSGLTLGLPGVLAGPFNPYAFLILLLAGGDYFLSLNWKQKPIESNNTQSSPYIPECCNLYFLAIFTCLELALEVKGLVGGSEYLFLMLFCEQNHFFFIKHHGCNPLFFF